MAIADDIAEINGKLEALADLCILMAVTHPDARGILEVVQELHVKATTLLEQGIPQAEAHMRGRAAIVSGIEQGVLTAEQAAKIN